jgi:hypothetical protein
VAFESKKFDYQIFDTNWLVSVAEYPNFIKRLSDIPDIAIAVEERLEKDFNSSLAEIKYKFLKNGRNIKLVYFGFRYICMNSSILNTIPLFK